MKAMCIERLEHPQTGVFVLSWGWLENNGERRYWVRLAGADTRNFPANEAIVAQALYNHNAAIIQQQWSAPPEVRR